jgi:diguanylate cyclase (GGDEF)-like protein
MDEGGLRVLVVDADQADRERVQALILAEGHAALSAGDTVSALACAERLCPHLVLLDPLVPGARGFELLRRLKQQPAVRRASIIFQTRRVRPFALVRALSSHDGLALCKPVELEALRRSLALTMRSRATIERFTQLNRTLLATYETEVLRGLFRQQALLGAPALARYELIDLLRQEQRTPEHRDVAAALLLFDFERLATLERRLGRGETDDLRRTVINSVRRHTRPGDLLAHFGRDELALVLPGVSPFGAGTVAIKLQTVVREMIAPLSGDDERSPGVGAVHFRLGRSRSIQPLLAQADRALFTAQSRLDQIALFEAAS